MNIKSLKLINFFSYKKQKILFQDDGIYIIYGTNKQTGSNNGVGKSVIKEAIKYVLFGKCRVNNLDDMIRFGRGRAAIQLDFAIGKTNYRIIRERKRNNNSNLRLIKLGCNEELTHSTIKETQLAIEEIIGIDYDKFMHSFCFGQSPYDDLKQMTSSKLINFLKSILNLERFNNYYKITKEKNRGVEKNLFKLEGKIETYNTIAEEIDEEKIKEQINNIKEQINDIGNKPEEFDKKERKLNGESQEIFKAINKQESKLKEVKESLSFISEKKQCPLCKQELENKKLKTHLKVKKTKFENNLSDLNKKYKKIEKKTCEISEVAEGLYGKRSKMRGELVKLEAKLEKPTLNFDIKRIKKQAKILRKQLGILEKAKDVFNSKGLPLYILQLYIPKLEYHVNDMLSKITDFKLNLKTQKKLKSSDELRNTCEIELFRGNKKYPLENLSNGEEFLITLAVRIGISRLFKTKTNFGTLILDECFGSLGDMNKQKVLSLINSLEGTFRKILVISHIDAIKSWSKPYKIDLIKDNGITSLK